MPYLNLDLARWRPSVTRLVGVLLGLACALPVCALDLAGAVRQALAHNPVYQGSIDDRRIADARLDIAGAGFAPRVDVEYGLSQQERANSFRRLTRQDHDSFSHREASASLVHTLLDFGNVQGRYDGAEALVRASAHAVRATAEDVAISTIGAYFEVLRRQQTVQLAAEHLAAHRRIREMIRLRSAGGVSRTSDLDQAESRLALAVASLRQEQAALDDAHASLLRIAGIVLAGEGAPSLTSPRRPAPELPGIWRQPIGEVGVRPSAELTLLDAGAQNDSVALPEPAPPCAGWAVSRPGDCPVPTVPDAEPDAETVNDLGVLRGEIADCPEHRGQEAAEAEAARLAFEYALAISLEQHPAVSAAREQVAEAETRIEVARSAFGPRLTFEAIGQRSDDVLNEDLKDVTVGLRARWNLFAGGADRAGIRLAGAELDRAREQLRRAEQGVTENLSQAGTQLLNARDRLEVLTRYLASIRSAQTSYVRQFSIGQRTLLDLVNSQDEVYSAGLQLITADYTARFAEYRVFSAMGRLLPTLGIEMPKAAVVSQ